MTHPDPFDQLRQHLDVQFQSVHRRIDDKAAESSRRFDDIDQTLNGNGHPGLVKLVDRHETRLNGERMDAKRTGATWGAVTSGVVNGLILAVAALFGIRWQQ